MQTFKVDNKECVALVRKLTPRECFRLMGVDDKDIDKIQDAGVSVSAQPQGWRDELLAYQGGSGVETWKPQ